MRRVGIANITGAAVRNAYRRIAVDLGAPARSINLRPISIPVFERLPESLPLGDVENGHKLLNGRFKLGSQGLDVGVQGDPWLIPAPSQTFAHSLHSFDWLADIAALRFDSSLLKKKPQYDERAQEHARHLVDRWISAFGQWNPYAWGNEILANRVFSWFSHWQILLNGDAQTSQGAARRTSLYRQLKRLASTYKRTPAGINRLKAAACLVLGGVYSKERKGLYLDRGLDLLDDEIHSQILPDGGHISRSPEQAALALEILIVVERALEAGGLEGSKEIRRAIDRLTPMVNFFINTDGYLFSFNGGGEGSKPHLKTLLANANIRAKLFSYAPHTKYQRLENNGTIIMVDVGESPPRPYDLEAHLAPLAFEMTSSAGPLIVNCGWNARQPQHWRAAMRGSAAHSTLTLGGQDAGRLLEGPFSVKLLGSCVARASGPVHAKRREQDSGTWLETSQESYQEQFGLAHRRHIYMDVSGTDVRGEDSLLVPLSGVPVTREEIPFEIRFHLHPSVKVTLAQDQKSALLIQPGGNGWRFRADAGPLRLEKSVYLGTGSKPMRSEQIVIYGRAYGDGDGQTRSNRVRWSLKQLGGINMGNVKHNKKQRRSR